MIFIQLEYWLYILLWMMNMLWMTNMKFIVIYMQTLQKMLFIVISKCVYEVRCYIKPPTTASWETQFCHCMLGKIWNTILNSSGVTSLSLPCSCFLITFRQEVVARRKQGLEQCLKKCHENAILELDTSISLRPCASCLPPCLDQALGQEADL